MPKYRKLISISDIDIRLMRVFCSVVKSNGFVLAELELNKSKSSISTDISNLETRLGAKLCNRGRNGFSLTPQGEAIYEAMLAFFEDMDQFHDQVSAITQNISGELRVLYEEDIGLTYQSLIVTALERFNTKNKNVFLNIRGLSSPEVIKAIQDCTAEVGITSLPRNVANISTTALFGEEMGLFCSDKHPLYDVPNEEISIERLHDEVFVDLRTRKSTFAAEFLDRVQIAARAPTMLGRMMLIKTGHYLGFLPHQFIERNEEAGTFREIRSDLFSQTNIVYLVVKDTSARNQKTTEFCKLVEDTFNDAIQKGRLVKPPA